jgi:hypothetical protein
MRIEEKTYETSNGELETMTVLIIPATIKSVSEETRLNSNGTEWRLCSVEITDPNGQVLTKQAQLFERTLEMFPEKFERGEQVELSIQTSGEGKGFAKIQLPAVERIDVDIFLEAAIADSEEHLVHEEEVN